MYLCEARVGAWQRCERRVPHAPCARGWARTGGAGWVGWAYCIVESPSMVTRCRRRYPPTSGFGQPHAALASGRAVRSGGGARWQFRRA